MRMIKIDIYQLSILIMRIEESQQLFSSFSLHMLSEVVEYCWILIGLQKVSRRSDIIPDFAWYYSEKSRIIVYSEIS